MRPNLYLLGLVVGSFFRNSEIDTSRWQILGPGSEGAAPLAPGTMGRSSAELQPHIVVIPSRLEIHDNFTERRVASFSISSRRSTNPTRDTSMAEKTEESGAAHLLPRVTIKFCTQCVKPAGGSEVAMSRKRDVSLANLAPGVNGC